MATVDRNTADETRICRDREVLMWRFDRLCAAGYPSGVAMPLAERADVDLELACRVLEQGATLNQAIRILT